MSIYIYADVHNGVNSICVDQIEARVTEYSVPSSEIVRLADSSYLDKELGANKKGTLVIGGGRTLYMAASLFKSAPKIMSAVQGGWNYLGFCAGANLSCEELLLRDGLIERNYSKKDGILGLLPATAKAPLVWDESIQDTPFGGKIVSILTSSTDDNKFKSYWNEGSRFVTAGNRMSDQTLPTLEAFYENIQNYPTAAISGSCGKGKVFISGFHPEIDLSEGKSDQGRVKFLHKMFAYTGINPKKKNSFFGKLCCW